MEVSAEAQNDQIYGARWACLLETLYIARIRSRASGFSPPVESDLERRPVLLPARPAPLCPRVIFHRCRKARKCNYGEIALRQTSTSPGLPGPIPHLSPDCGRQPHICMCFAEGRRGCGDPSHSARGSPQSGEAEAWGEFLDSGAKGGKGWTLPRVLLSSHLPLYWQRN